MTVDGHLSPVAPQAHVQPSAMRVPDPGVPISTAPTASVAPNGVTPELWNSLTAEEQAFFSAQSVRGALTYGPSEPRLLDTGLSRGHRIDVRV